MATVNTLSTHTVSVEFDNVEWETVALHATREGIAYTEAVADMVERILSVLSGEFMHEEAESRRTHTEDSLTIMLHVMYPKEGPLSVFDGTEKGLIACMLLETLDLGVHTVRHSRNLMEKCNGMERKDEGVGACKPSIPVNGRGESNLPGSGGPGSAEREVQG